MRRTTLAAAAVSALALGIATTAQAGPNCPLNDPSKTIRHVVFLEFDNVHLRRDNPNVPSDVEQMPHLLNFLESNGSLESQSHTVLISHTAAGVMSALTGVYPDRMGLAVSNSFGFFNPDCSVGFDVHVLDRPRPGAGFNGRHELHPARRRRQERTGAVGALYPRRLRYGRRVAEWVVA